MLGLDMVRQIFSGVTIGKGAVIAARKMVTKNVSDITVVGGVPAKVLSDRKSS